MTWSSSGATFCVASGSWSGSVATSGSEATGALTQNATYTLTCSGGGGTASASASVSVGATTNAAGNLDYTILFYDIAGAASSPLDTVVGGGGDGGNPGNYTVPFTLTPSTPKEIVLTDIMWDYNTAVGLSGGYFDGNRFSGENIDGPEPVDENNGWGHIITTSTNQVSLTWQVLQPNSDPIRYWAGLAVAFKGAP